MAQTYLFDDKGERWEGNSRALVDVLDASLSSEDLRRYVVRNLGFIAVTESIGSLRLQLRPAVVSQMALSGLIYWMHDRAVERVLISCLDCEWSHELVASREEAVRRLLVRAKFTAADREGDFLSKTRTLDELPRASPLWAMLAAWSECSGKYDRERLQRLLDEALHGRYMLVEPMAHSAGLLVKEIGTGFNNLTVRWLSRIRGLRVEDQPDYAYGKWVTTLYRKVVNTRAPSLEDIDAVITWPQQPRISYRYRRLVLPFEPVGDSTLLLSATIIDPTIDLRVKSN